MPLPQLKVIASFVTNQGDNAEALNPAGMRDNFAIHGTSETVTDKLIALCRDLGTLVMGEHDWSHGRRCNNQCAQ